MKAVIFSDTHGRCEPMLDMARRMRGVDLFIHLGDTVADAAALADAVYPIKTLCVAGNGDIGSREQTQLLWETQGRRVLAVHGHRQSVKLSTGPLEELAARENADLVLFGHTHVPEIFVQNGRIFCCPGTAGGVNGAPTAAMAEFLDGEIVCHLIDL